MKVSYTPPKDAGEEAKITLGLGEDDPATITLRRGEKPKRVAKKFEAACRAHPDIKVHRGK